MGTERDPRGERFQGIARLDPRWTFSRLRAKGPNPEDSSYTEQGARAGIPEAQQTTSLALKASGPQGDDGDLELLTRRAGHPLPDAGGFLVRDIAFGDASDEYAGHDGFQVITGWDGSLRYDTGGSGAKHRPAIIRLLSGDLLLVEFNIGVQHEVHRLDADDGTWANVATMILNPGTSDQLPDPALLQLPSGRVLYFYVDRLGLQVHVRYSDDDGTTWADYATGVLTVSAEDLVYGLSVAYARGTICLFTTESGSEAFPWFAQQWVSYDLGCTFSPVGETWFTGTSPPERLAYINLVGLPSGQVAMLYWWRHGGAGAEAYSFRLLDPSQPGYLADRTDLYTATDTPAFAEASCALWSDEDGLLYGLLEVEEGSVSYTMLLRSSDGGTSWHEQKAPTTYCRPSAQERPHNYAVASTGGRAAWAMRWSSGAAKDQSLAVAYLGGHAWATVGSVDDGTQEFTGRSFLGWGQELGGDTRFGGSYLPVSSPTSMGWTQAGAGTAQIVSPNLWRVSTAANTLSETMTDPASQPSIEACNAAFQVKVNSGGSLTSPQVGIRVRISDYNQPGAVNATAINEVELCLTTTGFRIYDAISGLQKGSDVSFDLTKDTWIMIAMRAANGGNGEVAVWYGRPFGPLRRLVAQLTSFSFADDSGVNPTNPSRVQWGGLASGTTQADWGPVGFAFYAHAFAPKQATNFVSSWDNPTDVRPRDFPTLPSLLLDRVKIQAVDGPTRLGEKWRIKTRYDYGVTNLHPGLSPSPRVVWRSKADNVTERIVWDLEGALFSDAFLFNHAMLFLLLNSNVREAKVLGWNVGGGSFDTLLTLRANEGFTGLPWERAGSTVRPDNTASAAGDRFLWRHQHAGDTFNLNAGEDPLHRIQTNSGGAWRVDGGTPKVKQPVVLLEKDNLNAGVSASGANGEIWCRDFGGVLREYTGRYQRFALEIPAHKTADGYYQIGAFFPGDLLAFGQQYDLGWVWTREWNTDLQEREDGTRRARKLGPARRSVQFAWVETAVQAQAEQADAPDPDWLSSGASALPLASRGDVIRAMEGLLEQADGPREPLVYLSRVPQQPDGTSDPLLLTDRRRWLYGRIGTKPKTEAFAARRGEAVDEVERLNAVTLEEEV